MAEPSIVFTDVNERQAMFTRRIFLMGGLVAFGMFALTGRLAHLQIVQGGKYKKLSAANQFNFRLIPPPRGNIYDRNGKLIAGNRSSFRVMIETNEVKNIDDTLDQVSYVRRKPFRAVAASCATSTRTSVRCRPSSLPT